ncbi:MAG: DUF305 domain-containing protein [Actinobacteria bacterium]|nr:DUF305 domain-containing protein [Actinomycetota bacterium]
MRRKLVGGVLTLLVGLTLAAAGCGGGGEEGEGSQGSAVAFDRAFIDAVVPHHESAIEMAKAAKQAGLTQPDLVEIADDIIVTQQEEIDRMLEWRKAWYGSSEIEPGAGEALSLSDSQMGMMHGAAEELRDAADVDQMFAEMMIEHHQGAITMASLALDKAEHDELKDLAEDIVEAQNREIDVMEGHAAGGHS